MEKKSLPEVGGDVVTQLWPLTLHGVPVRTGSVQEVSSPILRQSTLACPSSSETGLKTSLYREDLPDYGKIPPLLFLFRAFYKH